MKQTTFFCVTFLLVFTVSTEAKAESLVWKPLEEGPPDLIEAYKSDKGVSTEPLNPKIAKFVEVKMIGQKARVYLVNPYTEDLCGSGGCVSLGYIYEGDHYRQILNVLTDAERPGNPSIKVSKEMKKGLPCLDLHNFSIGKGKKARWCYNGKKYDFSRVRTESLQRKAR